VNSLRRSRDHHAQQLIYAGEALRDAGDALQDAAKDAESPTDS